jgi:hypothetical protein
LTAQPPRFSLRQTAGGWTLLDPGGRPFYALGLDHAAGVPSAEIRAAGLDFNAGESFAAVWIGVRAEDAFAGATQATLLANARAVCVEARPRASLIGYVLRGAPAWEPALVSAIRRLGADHPARQQYVDFLKDRYAYNIGRVNEAYGIESPSFTDLASYDFSSLDRTRRTVVEDDRAFLGWLADALYRPVVAELRACDPGRLVFSDALDPFADAVWLDAGPGETRLDPNAVLAARRGSRKPVLVADHRPGPAEPGVAALPFVIGYLRCGLSPRWREANSLLRRRLRFSGESK